MPLFNTLCKHHVSMPLFDIALSVVYTHSISCLKTSLLSLFSSSLLAGLEMLFFYFFTVMFSVAVADDSSLGGTVGSRKITESPDSNTRAQPLSVGTDTCACSRYWGGITGSRDIQQIPPLPQISSSRTLPVGRPESIRTISHPKVILTKESCDCKEFWGGIVASANVKNTPSPTAISNGIPTATTETTRSGTPCETNQGSAVTVALRTTL
ncbi:hypothetical protein NEOLI_003579 [Neolecta irregularis DAH-3]|uniref:Uncharacterized protein n=1 Tax=Neolecta irregularis (strain DAH-3) TaxID=1198029 RepID=A0A1U7LU42_NEOID|nr:hypothetical protein NEOLI_003579 [Neolecta irregularis DAH-3]|eukprot:OLL26190.1 hypothetical protein NEOLI_003579 [Neolecta irregularis DAH-3]